MTKRLTQEEVEKYYLDHGYELLSTYKNALTKNKIKNIKTANVYQQPLSKFKQGRRPENKNRKLTQEEVEKYYLDNGYELLSGYKNTHTKNKIKNIETGIVYEQNLHNFKTGQRPDNAIVKFKQEEVEKYYLKHGYELLSEYKNANTKNRIKELKTGKIYTQRLDASRRGSKPGLTKEDYERKVIAKAKIMGYTMLSKYKGMGNNNTFKCPMGHIFKITPDKLVNHYHSCPHCSSRESKGETFIRNILKYSKIEYEQEKAVTINNNTHRFDFIFSIKGKKYAIEYNGVQHYKPIGMFGGIEQYKNRVLRDKEKYVYCSEKGIQLISIPYIYDTPQKIIRFLSNRYSLDILPYDKTRVYMDKRSSKEIANYYLYHSAKETQSKYLLGIDAIISRFKQVYGITKRQYLKQHPELKN